MILVFFFATFKRCLISPFHFIDRKLIPSIVWHLSLMGEFWVSVLSHIKCFVFFFLRWRFVFAVLSLSLSHEYAWYSEASHLYCMTHVSGVRVSGNCDRKTKHTHTTRTKAKVSPKLKFGGHESWFVNWDNKNGI